MFPHESSRTVTGKNVIGAPRSLHEGLLQEVQRTFLGVQLASPSAALDDARSSRQRDLERTRSLWAVGLMGTNTSVGP